MRHRPDEGSKPQTPLPPLPPDCGLSAAIIVCLECDIVQQARRNVEEASGASTRQGCNWKGLIASASSDTFPIEADLLSSSALELQACVTGCMEAAICHSEPKRQCFAVPPGQAVKACLHIPSGIACL